MFRDKPCMDSAKPLVFRPGKAYRSLTPRSFPIPTANAGRFYPVCNRFGHGLQKFTKAAGTAVNARGTNLFEPVLFALAEQHLDQGYRRRQPPDRWWPDRARPARRSPGCGALPRPIPLNAEERWYGSKDQIRTVVRPTNSLVDRQSNRILTVCDYAFSR